MHSLQASNSWTGAPFSSDYCRALQICRMLASVSCSCYSTLEGWFTFFLVFCPSLDAWTIRCTPNKLFIWVISQESFIKYHKFPSIDNQSWDREIVLCVHSGPIPLRVVVKKKLSAQVQTNGRINFLSVIILAVQPDVSECNPYHERSAAGDTCHSCIWVRH
jgi:broad specificity phosphatase PhoE